MNLQLMTLWDLLTPKRPSKRKPHKTLTKVHQDLVQNPDLRASNSTPQNRSLPTSSVRVSKQTPMQEKYQEITRTMLAEYGVRVRKWRSSMSGVAWQVTYQDGTVSKLIESPKPKGPMSAAIFLHEIGHHAIGFGTYKPRCVEEYYAWKFSIDMMDELGLNVTDRVHQRMQDSLEYALAKALRRGLKRIPAEMVPYIPAGIQIHPDALPAVSRSG